MGGAAAFNQQQAMPQMQQSDPKAQLSQDLTQLNEKYFEEVKKAVDSLVNAKVAVHAHDKILDDQIDEFKSKMGSINENIQTLEQENTRQMGLLGSASGKVQPSAENIESMVYPENPLSEKLLKLQSKNGALDDAMHILKKAFNNDRVEKDEFLKTIRMLARKQFKTQFKINKLTKSMGGGSNPAAQPTNMPGGQAMPAMHQNQPMMMGGAMGQP